MTITWNDLYINEFMSVYITLSSKSTAQCLACLRIVMIKFLDHIPRVKVEVEYVKP